MCLDTRIDERSGDPVHYSREVYEISGLSGLRNPNGVSALAQFDDGCGSALYAGGNFYFSGDTKSFHIAKWAPIELPPGDLNCDGLVDILDIDPFILALFDRAGYAQRYPDCDINLADLNGDGVVDAFDIEPFIQLLFP